MLNIQPENLPKLRMSNSQTRSQISSILSARHKNKASFDSILDKSDLLSVPNRIRKKDNLSILDEALDAKEIFLRNTPNTDFTQEFITYKEHLDQLVVYIKNSNPILAFSVNRGIVGFTKIVNTLEKLVHSLQSKPATAVQTKKVYRDSQAQTSQMDEMEEWKMINKKDIKIFKQIGKKLEDLNVTKVAQKLREMQNSLRKAVAEVPGLTKFPELGNFNVSDTVNQLEKHVKSMQMEISSELIKRKLKNLPMPVGTQTDVPLIDPERYYILEKMLIDKEEEIFELNKKLGILQMEKQNLLEKFETSQSCLYQVEKRLYNAREKEAKFDRLKEEKEMQQENFEKKLMKRKEKLIGIKKEHQRNLFCLDKQRKMVVELVEEHRKALINGKVAQVRLEEIKSAWEEQFGESFRFSKVNMRQIVESLNLNILEKYDEIFQKSKEDGFSDDIQSNTLGSLHRSFDSPTKSLKSRQDSEENEDQNSSISHKKHFPSGLPHSFLNSSKSSNPRKNPSINPKTGKPFHSSSPDKFSKSKNNPNFLEGSENTSENSEFFQDSNFSSHKQKNATKTSFLSRITKDLIPSSQSLVDLENKVSVPGSTQFTEDSSAGSFYKKSLHDSEDPSQNPSEIFESLMEKAKNGERLTKIQEKFLQFYQGNNLKNLIREDPEEYLKHTFTFFDPTDQLHAKLLQEFPSIIGIPKKVQFEIFALMMEHEKQRCQGTCKHLSKVQHLKYKCKGVPYPIRKKNVEF